LGFVTTGPVNSFLEGIMNYYAKVIELMNNMDKLTDLELAVAMYHPAVFIRSHGGPEQKYDVVLLDHGEKKISCIKEIRAITGLGLKESKEMSETINAIIKRNVSFEKANAIADKLAYVGAEVIIAKSKGDHK
jgi:large subunit ribosomal protein L7/L12